MHHAIVSEETLVKFEFFALGFFWIYHWDYGVFDIISVDAILVTGWYPFAQFVIDKNVEIKQVWKE